MGTSAARRDWYRNSPTIVDGEITTAGVPARDVSAGGALANQKLIKPAGDKAATGAGLPAGPARNDTRKTTAQRNVPEGTTTAEGAGRRGVNNAPAGGARSGSADGRARVERNTVTKTATSGRGGAPTQSAPAGQRRGDAGGTATPARGNAVARAVQKRNLDAAR